MTRIMTKEESVKMTNQLIDVATSGKDMTVHDLLCVSFAFCSFMVESILNTYHDKGEIDEMKAGIKDAFIGKLAKHVDELEPKEG